MRGATLTVGVIVLLLPLAAGATVVELRADGEIHLPEGARADLDANVVYVADSETLTRLTLIAPRVRVESHDIGAAYVRSPMTGGRILLTTSHDIRSWEAEDVRIELVAGDQAGWLSATAPDARGTLTGDLMLTPSTRSQLGNSESLATDTDDRFPRFAHAEEAPHLQISRVSEWTLEGNLAIKIAGPDVTLRTNRNETLFRTGASWGANEGGTHRGTWLVLETENARIEAASPIQTIARGGTLAWDGTATIADATGAAREGRENLAAAAEDLVLVGRMTGEIHAAPDGAGAQAILAASGEARIQGLTTRAPGSPGDALPAWILGAALGIVAGGGATAVLLRRRANRERLGPDECARMAEAAAEDGRYQEAVEWTRRARAQSPASRRLARDEADFLALAGDPDGALAVLAGHGDPEDDIRRARLLAEAYGDEEGAATALVRALEASPALVLEIDTSPSLMSLAERADVRPAVERARRKLE